jgi:hypothetical protein
MCDDDGPSPFVHETLTRATDLRPESSMPIRRAHLATLAAFVLSSCSAISGAFESAESAKKSVTNEVLGGPSTCCVNQQFFECPDGAAGLQCLGEPVQMGQCIDRCQRPDSNGCQLGCVAEHGPDPSGCVRTPARDGECPPPS